jgi:hypothetical protein
MDPDFLRDAVLFSTRASQSLLGALTAAQEDATSSVASSPSMAEDWLLSVNSSNPEQRKLLLSIPEHLVDDIVTVLLPTLVYL